MSRNGYPIRSNFGLLPEPQRSPASFVTSAAINLSILALLLYVGMTAKRAVETHTFEQTELIFPTTPPPQVKVKIPPPPKIEQPKLPEVKLEAPKINLPKPEPKPEPIQMVAKVNLPVIKQARPSIILAPQPKAALTAAAPAQVPQVHASTAPVHLGETFGVTPNPNASRPERPRCGSARGSWIHGNRKRNESRVERGHRGTGSLRRYPWRHGNGQRL
jgi:outer membrane biosynthesis protein TonB